MQESALNYGNPPNKMPEWITALHEESAVTMAHGYGKATGKPVHALLGGALRSRVPAYVTGFYYRDGERPEDLLREAELYLRLGYRTVKSKVGVLPPEADAQRIGLIRQVLGKDPARVDGMLDELAGETQRALEDLRDLARGIYPPLLADKGLGAALEAQANRSPVPVSVAADGVGRYAPEIEAAVYFSCLEAMQNIAKYAAATAATIQLREVPGRLEFEIHDDGVGFDAAATLPLAERRRHAPGAHSPCHMPDNAPVRRVRWPRKSIRTSAGRRQASSQMVCRPRRKGSGSSTRSTRTTSTC